MPYSMPLWTILAKWPAPTGPACTKPDSPSGLSASKIGCAFATCSACRRTSGRSRSPGPRRRRRRRQSTKPMPLLAELRGVLLVVGPAGVAAVDDEVALGQQLAERVDGDWVGAPAGTITHTTRGAASASPARRGRRRRRGPGCGRSRRRCGRRGAGARACCRPSAEPDETDLHGVPLPMRSCADERSRARSVAVSPTAAPA